MQKFLKISKAGQLHKVTKKPCEDAIFIDDTNNVAVVCDGVSNALYGEITAKYIADKMGEFLATTMIKQLLKKGTPEKIRQVVFKKIIELTDNLCQKYNSKDIYQFACTFLALVEFESQIVLFHAGDGVIFGELNSECEASVSIISCPDNERNSGSVYHAGNKEQLTRMRVLRLNKGDYKSIALCTDGFSNPYFNPKRECFKMWDLKQVFNVRDNTELNLLVEEYHLSREINEIDDISCVIYRTNANETFNGFEFQYEEKNLSRVKENPAISSSVIKNEISPPPMVKKTQTQHTQIVSVDKERVEDTTTQSRLFPITILISVLVCVLSITTFAILNSKIAQLTEVNERQDKEINVLVSKCMTIDSQTTENTTQIYYSEVVSDVTEEITEDVAEEIVFNENNE